MLKVRWYRGMTWKCVFFFMHVLALVCVLLCFLWQVPTVLVVGATGEMGRVVVRKLLLRGGSGFGIEGAPRVFGVFLFFLFFFPSFFFSSFFICVRACFDVC